MNEFYTRKQAMERLALRSSNAFHSLEKRYPEAFVILNQGTAAGKHPHYDKAALDKFAGQREYLNQVASRQSV
jgi:hypothetical protein